MLILLTVSSFLYSLFTFFIEFAVSITMQVTKYAQVNRCHHVKMEIKTKEKIKVWSFPSIFIHSKAPS